MPPSLRAVVIHAAGEDVGRVGVDALPGRLAGQSAQIGQSVLVPHDHVGRWPADAAHCSGVAAAAAEAVREDAPHEAAVVLVPRPGAAAAGQPERRGAPVRAHHDQRRGAGPDKEPLDAAAPHHEPEEPAAW